MAIRCSVHSEGAVVELLWWGLRRDYGAPRRGGYYLNTGDLRRDGNVALALDDWE